MYSAVDLEVISTGELVETVHAALGVLAARSAPESGLVAMELGERLAAALDLGEAALAALVRSADREGAPSVWRYAGTRGWLKSACGMRTGRADERVTVARQLPRLPQVAASLEAGKLSYGHASTICDAVAQLSDVDCAKAERILLEAVADGLSATKVAKLGARIKEVIDERDGTDSPGEDCERGTRSWWRVSRSLGGGGAVKGWFDPELLALINDRLGPLARPAGPGDDRDHAQRMADALGSVLAGGGSNWQATLVIKLTAPSSAQGPDGGRADARSERGGGDRAHDDLPATDEAFTSGVGVAARGTAFSPSENTGGQRRHRGATARARTTCDRDGDGAGQQEVGSIAGDRAAGEKGMAPESGSQGRLPSWPMEDARVSARLADGTRVEPWQARILALNAGVSALVLGPDGIPLYLGRRSRFVSRHQRQVLEALYETCAADECDIPARLCQLDHVFNWVDDGTTDIDVLAPACAFHNRLKYQRPGWVISTRDQDGLWRYRVRRPRPRWGGGESGQARGP